MESLSASVASLSLTFPQKEGNRTDKFAETFQQVLEAVYSKFPEITKRGHEADMKKTLDWLTSVLKYNVPEGKQLRGRMVVEAYRVLAQDATEEKLQQARLLGWIVEIFQAASLIADDIMDGGTKRRGKPCWYRVDNIGSAGFNDAFMLEHFSIELIRVYFGNSPIYVELLELFYGTAFKTIMGQCLDLRNGRLGDFEKYTTSMYHSIVIYKTGFYTTFGPIAAAMILAGISPRRPENKELWVKIEEVALQLGILFQAQDDYLDCYANEQVLGKVGSDIQEGKCTWLFVTAKDKCSPEQLHVLLKNYGSEEPEKVATIKTLYDHLDIPNLFSSYQQRLYEKLMSDIKSLGHKALQTSFIALLKKVYKRTF